MFTQSTRVVKRFLLLLAIVVCGALANADLVQDGPRAVLNLNGDWQALPIEGLTFAFPLPPDGWKPVTVPERGERRMISDRMGPYAGNVSEFLDKSGTQFLRNTGIAAWYRRNFDAPPLPIGAARAILHFQGMAFRSDVWLNGQKLGSSLNGLTPVDYDVTTVLKPGVDNDLVVGLAGREALVDVANKTFLAPCAGVSPGLWGAVELRYLPAVQLQNVFAKTSVKGKTLTLDVTAANRAATAGQFQVAATVCDHRGQLQTTLAAVPLTLAAGETKVVTLSREWLPAVLWSPEHPVLLWAEVQLLAGEKVVDRSRVRFGFREFEIRGRDFYLNGIRTVLIRNSCLTGLEAGDSAMFRELRGDAGRPYNCVRLHIGFNSEVLLDQCDELGVMAIPESSWHNALGGKFPIEKRELWLPGVEAYLASLIQLHRNRPSVILWSLTNESMWGETDAARMQVADRLLAVAREQDPTRQVQGDAEVTWGGRLPVINIHYPESTVGNSWRSKFPNSGSVFPNDCHWLRKDDENGSWRATFKWDRPLVIGEYWYPSGDVDDKSSFMGESAYDWEKWRFQDMSGRDRRPDNEFVNATKMITDAYRMDGVAGINPWSGDRQDIMPAVAVRPVDFYPNFFAGETAVRRFVVFNDTEKSFADPNLHCRLSVNGRVVWEKIQRGPAAPGTTLTVDLPIVCPAATTPTPATLSVRLRHERGATWTELSLYEEQVFIVPRPRLDGMAADKLLLLDATGKTAAALAQLGLALPAKTALTDAELGGANALIIGDATDPGPWSEAIMTFARTGHAVLVLRQENWRPLSPELPEIDPEHVTTRSWLRTYNHPVTAGLDDRQFSYWRPDHLVALRSFRKPVNGAYRCLLDAGGLYGLRWSPLLEVPSGRGVFLLSQLDLAARVQTEPLAALLLERLTRHVAAYVPVVGAPPLRLLAAEGSPVRKALAEAGVQLRSGLDGPGPILVDASRPPTAAELELLRRHLVAGGRLWLHGFATPETLATVAPLLPFTPELSQPDPTVQAAVRRSCDPWLNNLSSFDFFWTRVDLEARTDYFQAAKATASLGATVLKLPAVDAGEALVNPPFLVKVPAGRGAILFDTLAWDKALGAEPERVTRVVAALAGNLGALVALAADDTGFDFFHVDLKQQANLGYYDPLADDGQGGWTDQGENDMRFFLINHTGKAGGRENGMEVEAQAFPETVSFVGRPFHLLNPALNQGRAVISLRGEGHGTKLPAEVTGIAVGQRADRLWFLQAAGWAPPKLDQEVARYRVRFVDGSEEIVPVRYGLEVFDWWNPQPIGGARVAWTGRNLAHSPVGIYLMEWRNPQSAKEIATLDVIGNLSPTQLVLLGVTGGTVAAPGGKAPAALIAAWDCAAAADGGVRNQVPGGAPLRFGTPPPESVRTADGTGLRFKNGSNLMGDATIGKMLCDGKPFTLRLALTVEGVTPGAMGGLFECMQYRQAGFRLVIYPNQKVGVEIFPGPEQAKFLVSRDPLQTGRKYSVTLKFDGQYAALLIDDRLAAMIASPLPAPCPSEVRLGQASGKDYFFGGVIYSVECSRNP